ncbi:hypothetical protein [Tellurirhabdus bombi]|uniref:hypothetical protein n=1 Tax=Tellurirhabdus bombi TaxID=2907205 RepID=UPI001F1D6D54|nr:hypothetical protein [Tellurirhabdus bombi]
MEKEKTHGGKRQGAGRKEGKTKISIPVTLDTDLIEYIDTLGKKRSAVINKIIRTHKDRIEQMIREADEANERFESVLGL